MTNPPTSLRYGLLVETPTVARWQAEVLESLAAVEGVELCAVVSDSIEHRRPTVREHWKRRRLAWTVFNRIASRRSIASQRVELPSWMDDVPRVEVRSRSDGAWREYEPSDVERIVEHRPDFVLRFCSSLVRGSVLDAFPLGVWSFHHGDELSQRGGPPCFWELVDGDPTTGVLLQRLTERIDAGAPLARAYFSTVPHSYVRNRDQAYLGAVELPAQVCRRILAGWPGAATPAPSTTDAPVRRAPNWRTLARFLPRLAQSWVRRQTIGLTRADRWHVGVADRPIESFLCTPGTSDVQWFPRPSGASRYVADPFGCPTDGGHAVLVEDFDHRERHGRISGYRRSDRGAVSGPFPVKEFPEHSSYPSLVEVGDEWWCIPETAKAGEVRALRFDPATFELDDIGTLLEDVAVSDPTLFEWDGRWWLFGTDHRRGANTHLRAWWAPDPHGPWTRHAIDPLAIDVRGARPAGTPFVVDGVLHRPAQDCSQSYGGAVVIQRVQRLGPDTFEETPVARIEPDPSGPYPDGVHTLSRMGAMTLVDGTRHRFSVPAFTHELRARAGRLRPSRGS